MQFRQNSSFAGHNHRIDVSKVGGAGRQMQGTASVIRTASARRPVSQALLDP
jgi:hypothetical protein